MVTTIIINLIKKIQDRKNRRAFLRLVSLLTRRPPQGRAEERGRGRGRSYKRVFGVEGRPGVYHAKVLVVDGVVAFVGSPNLTNGSLVNGELSLKVAGAAVATEVYTQAWAEAQRVESY